MQNTSDTATIYVAASIANLLTRFLDQRQLALPSLRERLTRLAQGPRMPITTWWALLDDIQHACHFASGDQIAIKRVKNFVFSQNLVKRNAAFNLFADLMNQCLKI